MYELIIIGGGPAGVAAGVYAARKRLKTLLITESFGGQSIDSMGIQNWIGTTEISGPDLAKDLESHLRAYAEDHLEIKLGERVDKVTSDDGVFSVVVGDKIYKSQTVLATLGSKRRKLDIPGAAEFENKGLTYCASCDGPLFAGENVVVIGGGNAGFESASQLLSYAKSVTLLHRGEVFKADEMTVEKVLSHPNMKAYKNAMPKEIKGDKFVESVIYEDSQGVHEIPAKGIFVEIGLMPNTSVLEGLVELNSIKQIPIDHKNQRTKIPGLWAAGDCTDALYHQNNIAAGDAVKALEDIYLYIRAGK